MTRPGNPANYTCSKSKKYGIHKWNVTNPNNVFCEWCRVVLSPDDARDLLKTRRD